jgi:hypothetical protein
MKRLHHAIATIAIALLTVACASGAASSSGPNQTPGTTAVSVNTPAEAAARVADVAPSLEGIGPKDPDAIGGCCFWEASQTADGFDVTFEVGWGDCPAGCIDRHRWNYSVSSDGAVTLTSESGSPVPSGVPGSGGGTTGGILPGGSGIEGRVLAGPSCPVVTVGDQSCDDRPVPGATLLVLDARGTEIARLVTDAKGHYDITLPSGPYTIEPQPVQGFLRKADPVPVSVGAGVVTVDIGYDTGIR